MHRSSALIAALGLTLALGISSDAPERERMLLQYAPALDHEALVHLLHDDDRRFDEFCRGIGLVRTQAMIPPLAGGLRSDTPQLYVQTRRTLYPYVLRVAAVMDSTFDRPEFARLYSFRASFGDSCAHNRLLCEMADVQMADVIPLPKKVELCRSLAERFARFGDERELMTIEAVLARDVMSEGRVSDRMRLLNAALARARRLYENHMICQLLGELGAEYGIAGKTDSMLACYREGIVRADRKGIPDQASRIRLFLANYLLGRGRLAAGASLLQEAQDAGRRLGGTPLEIRYVVEAMRWHADLHCWDLVHRNAARLPVMLRALERSGNWPEVSYYSTRGRRLNARWLAATGHAAEAADSVAALVRLVRPGGRREGVGPLLVQYAEVLLQAGRPRDALAAADSGIAFADSNHLSDVRTGLELVRARAALAEGQLQTAEEALVAFAQPAPDRPASRQPGWMHDGLAARIALARGDARLAERAIQRGLESLRDSIRSLDRGPYSDLTIHAAEDLSLAGHSLLARSPSEELAFERYWRSLPSWAGTEAGTGGRIVEGARVEPEDARHIVRLEYAVRPEGIVRWTVLASGVRRETLAIPPDTCRELVERVVERASRDPQATDAPVPDDLRELARSLGRELLPPEVRSAKFERVSISTEGPLARLPFELLDTSLDDDYVPLLSRADVRYERCVRTRPRRMGPERCVILADKGATARNGRPNALPSLAAIDSEIARARSVLPDPQVVRGGEIAKQDLLRAWSRASAIYVAAHLVRDPDAPLFNYFPITFSGVRDYRVAENDCIDIGDVRDTDLSGCGLVVLSSCASGEPYVADTHSCPSMADAFVDAGAKAVIHTRWRVRDESAAETAPRLTAAWRAGGEATWRAARLALLRGPHGIRHPFAWASWSVTTASPVPEWTVRNAALSVTRAIAAGAPHARPGASAAHAR